MEINSVQPETDLELVTQEHDATVVEYVWLGQTVIIVKSELAFSS